jgi:uncharacterized delta-60 repeat protein
MLLTTQGVWIMASGIRRGMCSVVIAALVVAGVATPALAAPGDLDPGFGTGGTVVTAFPVGSFANAVAVQPDGRIVAVGAAAGPSDTGEFAVARYEAGGSLDPTFSGDGMLTTPIAGGGDEARSVAIQSNGRIVVAGTDSRQRFAVARYRPNGTLDPTFGVNGIVRTDLTPRDDIGYDLVIQPDGKIVVVGVAGQPSPSFAVVRYRRDGTLDPTFGEGGKVLTKYEGGVARAVALQPNGRLVVAGYNGYGLAIARYRADGSLDPTFSGDGTIGHVVNPIFALDVALQPDGKIVAAGDFDIFRFGVARFTSDGRLDRTFSRNGIVSTVVGRGEQAVSGLVVERSGKIVAAGSAGPHEAGDMTVWRMVVTRYRSDGTLDPTWGGDGRVRTDFPGGGWARGAVLQADGKIVVAGASADGFALARYLTGA